MKLNFIIQLLNKLFEYAEYECVIPYNVINFSYDEKMKMKKNEDFFSLQAAF
jgi:hypothetical protein